MLTHFRQFAGYNAWANRRLYDTAEALGEEARQRDLNAFFASLHGTLNHILVADRVWMDRLEGAPNEFMKSYRLDTVTHPEWSELRRARDAMDTRIKAYLDRLTDEEMREPFSYDDSSGGRHQNIPLDVLPHVFNHQTHHRGQAHTLVKQLGGDPPSLDMVQFLRGAK